MARRKMTVDRFKETDRLIEAGKSDRFIAKALGCRRNKVSRIRLGQDQVEDVGKATPLAPLWTDQVDWENVIRDVGRGFEIKKIWEEKSSQLTTYPNFFKQLHKRYPGLMKASVTLREFSPGDTCEVDWAGDKPEWLDLRTGEIRQAHVFLGVLGFSQLIFAWAAENEQSVNWLGAHRRMYEAFGGVPHVTVCDCLKTGVSKTHRYDPDLNPGYTEVAVHYGTAVVPARPRHPKDKALVENAVGIVMRAFFFTYRKHTFTSLAEINHALAEVVGRINRKTHTRFGISRLERWSEQELAKLKPLPELPFEAVEWREAKVHPDCTLSMEGAYYSVPHIHRHTQVRVKLTVSHLEIFAGLDRVAMHARDYSRKGSRHIDNAHLPANAAAYREATPQNLLSQAKFVSKGMAGIIETLFSNDTLGNLRRVQGLVRLAQVELRAAGREAGEARIDAACAQMLSFNNFRVRYFEAALEQQRAVAKAQAGRAEKADREIKRLPGNPMLRHTAAVLDIVDETQAVLL